MTSTLSRSLRSLKSTLAAQDLLKNQTSIIKHGMLRKKGKKLNFGKWPHRFVVLTHDSIFIYDNETSKTPNSTFSLLGYNQVARCEVKGQDWCFSVIPALAIDRMKEKMFACVSDADRKSWMLAIKNQIYAAHNIAHPPMSILDKIKSMTNCDTDADEYVDLEHVVYEANNDSSIDKKLNEVDEDSDSSSDSDSDAVAPVYKKTTRSMSLPQNSINIQHRRSSTKSAKDHKFCDDVSEPGSSEYETCAQLFHSVHSSQPTKKRLPSDPQPRIPSDFSHSLSSEERRPSSDPIQTPPPRYSDVLKEEDVNGNDHDYVNLSTIRNDYNMSIGDSSLEFLCTIKDTSPNREQLNNLLKDKKEPGTYLVRQSRSDDHKVLAVLSHTGHVLEYKILGSPGMLTIDNEQYFSSIEELLQYYTSVEHLPCTDDFLTRGFYQVNDQTFLTSL